jgi:hypothetical protein
MKKLVLETVMGLSERFPNMPEVAVICLKTLALCCRTCGQPTLLFHTCRQAQTDSGRTRNVMFRPCSLALPPTADAAQASSAEHSS